MEAQWVRTSGVWTALHIFSILSVQLWVSYQYATYFLPSRLNPSSLCMISIPEVRASGCKCKCCNSPGFEHLIPQCSVVRKGETVLNIVKWIMENQYVQPRLQFWSSFVLLMYWIYLLKILTGGSMVYFNFFQVLCNNELWRQKINKNFLLSGF